MSEIRVDTISEKTSGSGTTVSQLKNPNHPFRNLLVNGDMALAQRGTSFSLTTGNSQFPVDRFKIFTEGSFAYTVSQSTDVPTGKGFSKSLKVDVTTGNASPSASSQTILQTNLEGQMLQHLCKGTSDAKKLTLSFYVKCTATGNLQVNLRDLDNARIIANTFTINSADTWEFKTITFAGDTSGAFDNDNNGSLRLGFMLGTGTDYKGGAVPTSWEAFSNSDKNAGDTLNFSSSASNDFFITGVQLEVGETATDFEHLPHDVQLDRCMRYAYVHNNDADSHQQLLFLGATRGSTNKTFYIQHPRPMRDTPSITLSGEIRMINIGQADNVDADDTLTLGGVTPSIVGQNADEKGCGIFYNGSVSGITDTGNTGYILMFQKETDNKLTFDAEL